MNQRVFIPVAVLIAASSAALCHAQNDRVRTSSGAEAGQVTAIARNSVTLRRGSTTKEIPVSEIVGLQLAGEPSELNQARVNARNGGYRPALEKLSGIDLGAVKDKNIKLEINYYTLYCRAKLALLGSEDITVVGRDLNAFVRNNPQSWHYYDATQLLGDLLTATGRYGPAERMYSALASAPFPSLKARAGVLTGRSLQKQDKHAEALRTFDTALAAADDTPEGDKQRLAALLGKAVSLSATGRADDGVGLVRQVLRDADPAESGLLAAAYTALGGCYLQADQPKDALFAFLHVDLLFATEPEAHAESLYHLAPLWEAIGKPQQARRARQTLKERYAASTWAKQ